MNQLTVTLSRYCGRERDVTTKYTLAHNKGDTDHLKTQGDEVQVGPMCNWVRRSGGTWGRRSDLKREEGVQIKQEVTIQHPDKTHRHCSVTGKCTHDTHFKSNISGELFFLFSRCEKGCGLISGGGGSHQLWSQNHPCFNPQTDSVLDLFELFKVKSKQLTWTFQCKL